MSADQTGFYWMFLARLVLFGNLSGLKFTVMVYPQSVSFPFYAIIPTNLLVKVNEINENFYS